MRDEMRTFGYLCPKCGKTVMAARSVFALEASNAEVACSCGESALRVTFDGERYYLSVPCGLCGETHSAVCPPERMLEENTALACGQTGQFSCFIGDEGTVERNLRELAVQAEKEKQQSEEGPEVFADNVIMYEVLSELKEIAQRDGISCTCGSHRWKLQVNFSSIDLFCADCGGAMRIPAATASDIDDICCKNKLVIHGQD